MSDEKVHTALRSDVPLVIVEAPAGCGKTHQGAEYARDRAGGELRERVLILTHTHAACSVFAERTRSSGSRSEVRTIDSLIGQLASVYHQSLGLPADVAAWVRRRKEGHAEIAIKVASLVRRYPMIARAVARRYPHVICDEHQDSSGDQHAILESLMRQGARLRIFADPMQEIFPDVAITGAAPPYDWSGLASKADAFEVLGYPHRWRDGCSKLGAWTLKAREDLKSGRQIDLRNGLPPSVEVVSAENSAQRNLHYSLTSYARRPLDRFVAANSSLLILTRYNDTALSLRAFFNRSIPLWEGQTRPSLDALVETVHSCRGHALVLGDAVIAFMGEVAKGFSRSQFGDAMLQEIRAGCSASRRGKPASIQSLARLLLAEPDHRGISKLLERLHELASNNSQFADVKLDCNREFWDAIRLGGYEDLDLGLADITNRRIYSRSKPPDRAISTIHKAKGLECDAVLVMPCDRTTFPDKQTARCLLYVALSRAKKRLMFVVSQQNPSPLLML